MEDLYLVKWIAKDGTEQQEVKRTKEDAEKLQGFLQHIGLNVEVREVIGI